MSNEKELASALAVTSAMLAEALPERDQYREWWVKRNAECDELQAEVTKLRSELKNTKAALAARDGMAAALSQDASPFEPEAALEA